MFMGTLSCGLLYELTWKGEYYTRRCLIILFCLFLSSNALHVAANSHEASALAYSVAPELVRHIRRMENRFGFTQGKWGLRWLGKSSAPMATPPSPPPISWKKEERAPFFCSAVMISHSDHTCCTAIVHLAQKIKEYKESTEDRAYVFAFAITRS